MSNKTDFEALQQGITTEQRGKVSELLKSKAGKGYKTERPLNEREYGKWNRYLKSIGVKSKTTAPKVSYSTAHLREMEEKKRYQGRGKYKRDINRYSIDAKDRKSKEVFRSAIGFGWNGQKHERKLIRSRARDKHISYSVRVRNETTGRLIKPYGKTV